MSGREKESFLEKASAKMNIPYDLAAGVFRVTVTGSRSVYIENHRGILEYESGLIRINCGKTIISVTGSELEVESISSREMLISGSIAGVALER